MSVYVPLVSVQDVLDAWPAFSNVSGTEQTSLITDASRAIERECDRILGTNTYDRIYRPGRVRHIRLHQWPVTAVLNVSADLNIVMHVQYTGNAFDSSLSYTYSGPADQMVPTGIALTTSPDSATPSTTNLLFATYPTVGQLATAINAVSGWTASVATGAAGGQNDYSPINCADLNPQVGQIDAQIGILALQAYTRRLQWTMDTVQALHGELELFESFPDGYRYPDRKRGNFLGSIGAWTGVDPKIGGVRVRYTAGYATADVPNDLKRACVSAIVFFRDRQLAPGAFKSKSIGKVSYTLADLPKSSLPEWILALCDGHRRIDIA